MVSRQGFEEYCFSDSVLRPDKAGLSADLLKKHKKDGQTFGRNNIFTIFALPFRKYFCREDNIGEVVEWSITAVLKTVELKGSGGSNPSLSAEKGVTDICNAFFNFSVTKNVTYTTQSMEACVSGLNSLPAKEVLPLRESKVRILLQAPTGNWRNG